MTGEEMERAIQFFIEHHPKVSTDKGLREAQQATAAIVSSLAESVSRLEAQAEVDRREVREMFARQSDEMHRMFDGLIHEMRDGFKKLILSNEVTRDRASQVAPVSDRNHSKWRFLKRS